MFGRRELKSFLTRQLTTLLDVAIHSLSFRLFLLGLLLGPLVLAIGHHHMTLVGSSLAARTGALIAITFGLAWASSRNFWSYTPVRRRGLSRILPVWILSILGLIGWVILLPYTGELQRWLASMFSVDSLTHSGPRVLYYTLLAIVSLTLPARWIVRTADALAGDLVGTEANNQKRTSYQRYLLRYGTGLVSGIAFSSLVLAPYFGLQIVAWCCATVLIVVCIERLVQGEAVKEHQAPFRFQSLLQDERSRYVDKLWQAGIWATIGGTLYLLQRMFTQYMPGTVYVSLFVWLGFAIGLLWGLQFIARRQGECQQSQEKAGSALLLTLVGVSAWTVILFLSSDVLLNGSLWISAYWSKTWMITLVRLSAIIIAVAPLGLTAVCVLYPAQPAASINIVSCCRWHRVLALATGCVAVQWSLAEGISFFTLMTGCQWLLLAFAGLKWAETWKFSYSKPVVACLGLAVMLVLAAPLADRFFDASRTAKYLFSSDIYAAYRNGTDPIELGVLSDQRLVEQVEGESATYTVWSQNGMQQVIRADGMPRGVFSLNSSIVPESPSEVLQTVIPLNLHRAPHQVMLLGAPSGSAVKSCLLFPIQELTCVEAEETVLKLAREYSWKDQSPEEDVRYQHWDLPPQIALMQAEPQDVIINNPPMSMLQRATSYFTQEFYQSVAQALTEDGLFCQRFQHFDYGPQPLCDVVATMRSAFRSVCTIRTGAGEVILVGTNSDAGVDRDGFLDRLRKPHSRRALASIGWDWAVPLEILQLDDDAWTDILKDNPGRINTAANGRLAYGLPHEMLRWGNKAVELQQVAGQHFNTVYAWVEEEDDDRQVSHRFEELKSLRELQTTANGKYWVYRSSVRKRVQDKPRTVIKQVRGVGPEERLHEEDRRRLEYFQSLGNAFQAREITLDHLRDIEQFTQPYDPLVTYFAHMELAALCEREPEKFQSEELRHLLHTIFYGSSQDRSIKSIARAMKLLVEHPEVVENETERADLLNSMLQMMKARWMLRGHMPVGSLGMSHKDITDSLEVIELTFDEFEKFEQIPELQSYAWAAREKHLERFLVSPLRTFRSQLSIAQAKREHDLEMSEVKNANATLQKEVEADAAKRDQPASPISNAVFEAPNF